jgi:hypothetical protein
MWAQSKKKISTTQNVFFREICGWRKTSFFRVTGGSIKCVSVQLK